MRRRSLNCKWGADDISSLHAIAVSPDASVVAWAAGSPLHVVAVDTASGTRIEVPTGMNPSGWRFLAISPDARQLSLKSGFGFLLLDISGLKLGQTDEAVLRRPPSSGLLNSYTFSPDGKLGAGPTFNSVIHLHDIESGQTLRTFTGHSTSSLQCFF